MKTTTLKKTIFLSLIFSFTLLVSSSFALAQEAFTGISPSNLSKILKVDTKEAKEAYQVAMRIIKSSQRLSKNPLNKEILISMVQAAFDKPTVVANLIDFDALLPASKSSSSDHAVIIKDYALNSGEINE